MQRFSRDQAKHYVFDKDNPPVLEVEESETFIVETKDALSGKVHSERDPLTPQTLLPYSGFEPSLSNPLSGPISIKGAEHGDTLVVCLEEVTPVGDGVTGIIREQGTLCDSRSWETHREPLTRIIRHENGPSGTLKDGRAVFNDTASWDLHPFIGTIGVAPHVEVETSAVGQGVWGGNWDCRDIRAGSRIYLNVFHPGALLSLGDVHASQGDGEWSGIANEVEAEIRLHCEVIKGKKIPYARIEKEHSIISLRADRPLEEAVNGAMQDLLGWMVDDYGMDPREVYMLFSVCPDFRINAYQVVKLGKINFTAGAEIPKHYLPVR